MGFCPKRSARVSAILGGRRLLAGEGRALGGKVAFLSRERLGIGFVVFNSHGGFLLGAMAEHRLQLRPAPGGRLCDCEHCRGAFLAWLRTVISKKGSSSACYASFF